MQATLEVPCVTYYYREAGASSSCYHLEAMAPSTQVFHYSADGLARSTLVEADLAQIQLFDDLMLPECNALSVRLVLMTARDGAYVCMPTPRGHTLRVLSHAADPPPYALDTARYPRADTQRQAVHAATVFTWYHQYTETGGPGPRYHMHRGLTLLPSKVSLIPLFLTPQTLRDWLKSWSTEACSSKLFAQLHIRSHRCEYSLRRVVPLSAWSKEAAQRYPGQTDRNAEQMRASYELPFVYPLDKAYYASGKASASTTKAWVLG